MSLVQHILSVLNESSAYLLLGFTFAGVLHVVLGRFPSLTALISQRRPRSVWLAALFGLPMPLCSCSVLPAAVALRERGASKGATTSFLISVPETDVVSIMLTYALLGPIVAVYRPLSALVSAVVTGVAVETTDRGGDVRQEAGNDAVCHHHSMLQAGTGNVFQRVYRFGFVELFDDIVLPLLLGIFVAGAVLNFVPPGQLGVIGAPWIYIVMLVVGIPVYVCAAASTPIAAGLIAGGMNPGAAIIFLLAGPATNLASLLVLKKHLGTRALVVYWVGIAVTALVAGIAFDALFGGWVGEIQARVRPHGDASPFQIAATVVFLMLVAVSLWRRFARKAAA